MDLDKILLEQDITYEKVKDFISARNEENYYKILSRISRFPENDAKIICKEIINNSENEDMIDRVCMEIITFIQYDYDYYKEIININAIKNIDENKNYDSKTTFIKDLKNKAEQHNKEEKVKYNMEIFKPDTKRMIEYRKFQFKQNKEINKIASKKSIIGSLFKSNTILYGRKYGLAVTTKDSKEISVGSLHEFKYEYTYPIEYLVDPVEYIEKINSLKNLGRGK